MSTGRGGVGTGFKLTGGEPRIQPASKYPAAATSTSNCPHISGVPARDDLRDEWREELSRDPPPLPTWASTAISREGFVPRLILLASEEATEELLIDDGADEPPALNSPGSAAQGGERLPLHAAAAVASWWCNSLASIPRLPTERGRSDWLLPPPPRPGRLPWRDSPGAQCVLTVLCRE